MAAKPGIRVRDPAIGTKTKRARWLGRAALLFFLTFFPPLVVASRWVDIGASNGGPLGLLSFTLALQSVGIVGYVIALRQPRNAVGWVMIALGLVLPGASFLGAVTRLLHDPLPVAAAVIAVLSELLGGLVFVALWLLAIVLFPDGRLPARVWRILLWPLALGLVAYEGSNLLATPVFSDGVPNPIFVPGMQASEPGSLPLILLALGVVAVLASPVWRWRRALGGQRSQLKWLALAGVVALGLVFSPVGPAIFRISLALLVFSAAAGIAILRDRLFDIDFVINRGALYGTVTIVLLAAFVLLSSVIEQLLGSALREQFGAIRPLVAVAVLPAFRPLERRVRPFADRLLPANERLALLFTDIVGSTDVLSAVGDARWRELLDRYYAAVRSELRTYGGTEIDTTGDGFFATFRDPVAVVRCALAIIERTRDQLSTRVGVHFGDCDMHGGHPLGINVHVAARVMAAADSNAVFVSESCRDAIAVADLVFEPLGPRALKGISGQVHLYRLSRTT